MGRYDGALVAVEDIAGRQIVRPNQLRSLAVNRVACCPSERRVGNIDDLTVRSRAFPEFRGCFFRVTSMEAANKLEPRTRFLSSSGTGRLRHIAEYGGSHTNTGGRDYPRYHSRWLRLRENFVYGLPEVIRENEEVRERYRSIAGDIPFSKRIDTTSKCPRENEEIRKVSLSVAITVNIRSDDVDAAGVISNDGRHTNHTARWKSGPDAIPTSISVHTVSSQPDITLIFEVEDEFAGDAKSER